MGIGFLYLLLTGIKYHSTTSKARNNGQSILEDNHNELTNYSYEKLF